MCEWARRVQLLRGVTIFIAIIALIGCVNDNDVGGGNRSDSGTAVRLIYDTDIGDDVDDAMALAMLHGLAANGEVELLAVTVSKPNFYAAVYCDLVNIFYGRDDIPIGLTTIGTLRGPGPYVEKIATEVGVDGSLLYERNLKYAGQTHESVSLLRKTLSEQGDRSVVIVQVGYATNMARLLGSGPDEYSSLNGRELVRQKVKLLSVMSGYFGTERTGFAEHNIRIDVASAQKVFAEWPTPVVVSGWEVGRSILYPATSIENDFAYVEHHPIKEAYELWSEMPYDRPTYDLTSVLYAVRSNEQLFDMSVPGYVHVHEDGVTSFVHDAAGPHRYLTVTDSQRAKILELFLELVPYRPKVNS